MTPKELRQKYARLLQTDPLVNACHQAWLVGNFASLEECLVATIVALAEDKKEATDRLEKFYHHQEGPVFLKLHGVSVPETPAEEKVSSPKG